MSMNYPDLELTFTCTLLCPWDGQSIDAPLMEDGRSRTVTEDNPPPHTHIHTHTHSYPSLVNSLCFIYSPELVDLRLNFCHDGFKPVSIWNRWTGRRFWCNTVVVLLLLSRIILLEVGNFCWVWWTISAENFLMAKLSPSNPGLHVGRSHSVEIFTAWSTVIVSHGSSTPHGHCVMLWRAS